MITRIVATAAPWQLEHGRVGGSRYWYVRHAPSGKLAASFDSAPCRAKVADVKAKFLAMVAPWPDMTAWNPEQATSEEIRLVRTFMTMLERASATEYRVSP